MTSGPYTWEKLGLGKSMGGNDPRLLVHVSREQGGFSESLCPTGVARTRPGRGGFVTLRAWVAGGDTRVSLTKRGGWEDWDRAAFCFWRNMPISASRSFFCCCCCWSRSFCCCCFCGCCCCSSCRSCCCRFSTAMLGAGAPLLFTGDGGRGCDDDDNDDGTVAESLRTGDGRKSPDVGCFALGLGRGRPAAGFGFGDERPPVAGDGCGCCCFAGVVAGDGGGGGSDGGCCCCCCFGLGFGRGRARGVRGGGGGGEDCAVPGVVGGGGSASSVPGSRFIRGLRRGRARPPDGGGGGGGGGIFCC
mmetsp:Transcript_31967/g.39201  ORF Transcript_31967/g.39201 Transcript_31967/m.39201 type:complete len:303 (+) Transcript_31967:3694-4602(+)